MLRIGLVFNLTQSSNPNRIRMRICLRYIRRSFTRDSQLCLLVRRSKESEKRLTRTIYSTSDETSETTIINQIKQNRTIRIVDKKYKIRIKDSYIVYWFPKTWVVATSNQGEQVKCAIAKSVSMWECFTDRSAFIERSPLPSHITQEMFCGSDFTHTVRCQQCRDSLTQIFCKSCKSIICGYLKVQILLQCPLSQYIKHTLSWHPQYYNWCVTCVLFRCDE